MKVVLYFLLAFIVVFAASIKTSGGKLLSIGFPFKVATYKSFSGDVGDGMYLSLIPLNLVYDLLIIGLVVGAVAYMRRTFIAKKA